MCSTEARWSAGAVRDGAGAAAATVFGCGCGTEARCGAGGGAAVVVDRRAFAAGAGRALSERAFDDSAAATAGAAGLAVVSAVGDAGGSVTTASD